MTKRAKRMMQFLYELGWEVQSLGDLYDCSCGQSVESRYCHHCGQENPLWNKDTVKELEAAIKYALEEEPTRKE